MTDQATATLPTAEFVVRPTVGLYLRRLFQSNGGKLVAFTAALAIGAAFGASPVLGIAAAAALVALLAVLASRTKIHAAPGRLVIGNGVRVHEVPTTELAGLVVQPVVYRWNGIETNKKFRVLAVVSKPGNGSKPVTVPAFASERGTPELIHSMINDMVKALQVSAA